MASSHDLPSQTCFGMATMLGREAVRQIAEASFSLSVTSTVFGSGVLKDSMRSTTVVRLTQLFSFLEACSHAYWKSADVIGLTVAQLEVIPQREGEGPAVVGDRGHLLGHRPPRIGDELDLLPVDVDQVGPHQGGAIGPRRRVLLRLRIRDAGSWALRPAPTSAECHRRSSRQAWLPRSAWPLRARSWRPAPRAPSSPPVQQARSSPRAPRVRWSARLAVMLDHTPMPPERQRPVRPPAKTFVPVEA